MSSAVAKIVYSGEGASISFGAGISYIELCESIRSQFPDLRKTALDLKFSVLPDSTIYRLRNDVDISMLFMVLNQLKSSWVDIKVTTLTEATIGNNQPPASGNTHDSISGDDANQYLGCFRREDARTYMTSSWNSYITHKGQMFERGANEFREKLRMYAIEVGFEYTFQSNKPDRVISVCKKRDTEGCNWCVKASLNRYLTEIEFHV